MKRSSRWELLGLATFVILLVAVFRIFASVTGNAADKAVTEFEERAKELLSNQQAKAAPAWETPNVLGRTPPTLDAEDRIAVWRHLFEPVITNHDYYLDVWDEAMSLVFEGDWATASDERIASLKALLADNADLLEDTYAAAAVGWPDTDPNEGITVSAPAGRICAGLVIADAHLRNVEGDTDGVVEALLVAMRIADILTSHRDWFPPLSGQGVYLAAIQASQTLIPRDGLADSLRDKLLAQLENAHARQSLVIEIVHNAQEADQVLPNGRERPEGIPTVQSISDWLYQPWADMDKRALLDLTLRLAEAARLPYFEARPLLEDIEESVLDLPRTRWVTRCLLHADQDSSWYIRGLFKIQAQHEAAVDLMRMGLLLEQYYVDHGCYPERLDAIAEGLGGSVPVDPFTGEPFHYTPQADTFLLYSVGVDLEDDGGRHDYRDGDLVWRGVLQE